MRSHRARIPSKCDGAAAAAPPSRWDAAAELLRRRAVAYQDIVIDESAPVAMGAGAANDCAAPSSWSREWTGGRCAGRFCAEMARDCVLSVPVLALYAEPLPDLREHVVCRRRSMTWCVRGGRGCAVSWQQAVRHETPRACYAL